MPNILRSIILVLFLFSIASCQKEPNNPGNQQQVPLLMEEECTPNSSYHVGFKQLNEQWCADFEIRAESRNRIYIRAESINGILFEAYLTDYFNGNFALDGDRNQIIINRFGNVFQSHNTITGNIDILEYSPSQQIIGANFNFSAINFNSGEQQFIQGSFRVRFF